MSDPLHPHAAVSVDEALLVVRNLSVTFEVDQGTLRAASGVSLRVEAGRTLGIVGESGSGKSVVARAVMGNLARGASLNDDSVILFDGRDVKRFTSDQRRGFWGREVAMVYQNPMTSLTPVLKIGRQIMEPLRHHLGLSRAEAEARAIALLEDVGIPEPARRLASYPHNPSGGMRQRVLIAIALSCEPQLLIADEPTTALDVTIQQQILDLPSNLQRSHRMAMILISHDLGVVAGRTDDIAVMYAGRIVERAPTRALFENTRHPYTNALLASIPRTSTPSGTRLSAIPGRPPAVLDDRPGCRFAPRCHNALPQCRDETPPLESHGSPTHEFACFNPVERERS